MPLGQQKFLFTAPRLTQVTKENGIFQNVNSLVALVSSFSTS